jgi:hypothetical protein
MAGIQSNSFSWNRQPSYWQQLQERRERSKALREQFEATNAELNAAITGASNDLMTGAGELAAKTALKRLEDEAAAKQQQSQLDAAKNFSVWKNEPLPTTFNAGETTVDLALDTLTLSDGTVIDLKTGKPPGNFLILADGSKIDLDTGHKVIDIVT